MSHALLIGSLLVLIGLSMVIKTIFGITIPLMRPLLGGFLVYVGLNIIMDPFSKRPKKINVTFGNKQLSLIKPEENVSTAFGTSVIDLSHMTLEQTGQNLEINTAFGTTTVILNPDIPVKVIVSASFGCATLPDGSMISFGKSAYQSENTKEETPFIINARVMFGSLAIKMAKKDLQKSQKSFTI